MLAERDPQALALQARYKNLVMPNLSLGVEDTQALMGYFEEETQRLEREHRPAKVATATAVMAPCH